MKTIQAAFPASIDITLRSCDHLRVSAGRFRQGLGVLRVSMRQAVRLPVFLEYGLTRCAELARGKPAVLGFI